MQVVPLDIFPPAALLGRPTRLAPLALDARRILIHLQCQILPGKVSLRRLRNHLSGPITPRAVKANSELRLARRHPQLGLRETKHGNGIKSS